MTSTTPDDPHDPHPPSLNPRNIITSSKTPAQFLLGCGAKLKRLEMHLNRGFSTRNNPRNTWRESACSSAHPSHRSRGGEKTSCEGHNRHRIRFFVLVFYIAPNHLFFRRCLTVVTPSFFSRRPPSPSLSSRRRSFRGRKPPFCSNTNVQGKFGKGNAKRNGEGGHCEPSTIFRGARGRQWPGQRQR